VKITCTPLYPDEIDPGEIPPFLSEEERRIFSAQVRKCAKGIVQAKIDRMTRILQIPRIKVDD